MYGGLTSEKDMIANHDVPTEDGVVCKGDVVSDPAIVAHVRSDHQETTIADRGDAAAVFGACVDRHGFTDLALRSNDEAGGRAAVLHRLRCRPERSERINDRAGSDAGMASEMNVSYQACPGSEGDVRSDDAIRTDRAVRANGSFGMNNGGWVDLRSFHDSFASTSMNVTSASLTGSEFTEQTPFARPIFPRDFVNSTSMTSVSPGRTGLRHLTLSAAMK